MTDCGCKVNAGYRITYCDLHAHAADYKMALERIRATEHNGECPYEDDNDNPCDCHVALADAVLKGDE